MRTHCIASTVAIGLASALLLGSLAGCSKDRSASPTERAVAEIPVPHIPTRIAAEDHDLRVMLAEVAAAKACDGIRGQFRALRASDRPGVVTGGLVLEECRISQRGTRVTFHLKGRGWQWALKQEEKAGAKFKVRQYVRFAIDTSIPGALDLAYDTDEHILSVWFTPSKLPDVTFTTIGDIAVDEQGAWSEVVGAVATTFAQSPEEKASDQAEVEGARDFKKQFADGMSLTVDLCTGLQRFGMGRPYAGKMMPPDSGETPKIPGELQPGGLLIFGPYQAPKGMTVKADVSAGGARVELVCTDEAAKLADSFFAGNGNTLAIKSLARKDLRGKATLKVKKASCPVAVVVRPLGTGTDPVVFDWVRPAKEFARAAGGPIIRCGK